MTEPARSWTLVISAPARFLSLNNTRGHWTTRAEPARLWREATYWLAVQAKLPRGLSKVHIHATFHFTDRRKRDKDNLAPTLKPIIDALTPERRRIVKGKLKVSKGYGLMPDDTPEYLTLDWTIGDPVTTNVGIVELHITELV